MDSDSACSRLTKSDDDGFFEEMVHDAGSPLLASKLSHFPSGLMGLICAPLASCEDDKENAPPRLSSSLDDHQVRPTVLHHSVGLLFIRDFCNNYKC